MTPLNTIAGVNGAYIPGVLTAAGVTGAFGAIYAAHGLYAFIDVRTAFPALGIVALAAIAAAMLHGPALAGLGLVGALATPLLVSSERPNPWPVVFYLAVVVSAAYALARLRRWLWLAAAAAIGAGLWTLLLDANSPVTGVDAAYSCLIVQLALAGLAFAILPHRGESDETAEFDPRRLHCSGGFRPTGDRRSRRGRARRLHPLVLDRRVGGGDGHSLLRRCRGSAGGGGERR